MFFIANSIDGMQRVSLPMEPFYQDQESLCEIREEVFGTKLILIGEFLFHLAHQCAERWYEFRRQLNAGIQLIIIENIVLEHDVNVGRIVY